MVPEECEGVRRVRDGHAVEASLPGKPWGHSPGRTLRVHAARTGSRLINPACLPHRSAEQPGQSPSPLTGTGDSGQFPYDTNVDISNFHLDVWRGVVRPPNPSHE